MLAIFGIVAVVVLTYQNYKSAVNTERNGMLWALLTAGIGVGFQFVVPFIFGVVLAIYYIAAGAPPDEIGIVITGPAAVIGIVCLILSVAGMVLVSKHVSKVKDTPLTLEAPPPPPIFGAADR